MRAVVDRRTDDSTSCTSAGQPRAGVPGGSVTAIVSCSVQYGLLIYAYRHVVVQEQTLLLLTEYSQGLWCRGIYKPGPSAVGWWVGFFFLVYLF